MTASRNEIDRILKSVANSRAGVEWPPINPKLYGIPQNVPALRAHIRDLEEHRQGLMHAYARLREDFERTQALCHEMLGIPKR